MGIAVGHRHRQQEVSVLVGLLLIATTSSGGTAQWLDLFLVAVTGRSPAAEHLCAP